MGAAVPGSSRREAACGRSGFWPLGQRPGARGQARPGAVPGQRDGTSRCRRPGVCFSWRLRGKPGGAGRLPCEPARRPSLGSPQRKAVLRGTWRGNCWGTRSFHALGRPSAPCADRAFTWELAGKPAGGANRYTRWSLIFLLFFFSGLRKGVGSGVCGAGGRLLRLLSPSPRGSRPASAVPASRTAAPEQVPPEKAAAPQPFDGPAAPPGLSAPFACKWPSVPPRLSRRTEGTCSSRRDGARTNNSSKTGSALKNKLVGQTGWCRLLLLLPATKCGFINPSPFLIISP